MIASFDFEKNFPVYEVGAYVLQYQPLVWISCFIYYVAIRYGIDYMKYRKPKNLRFQLIFWNLFLTLFSIFGAFRMFQDFVIAINQDKISWYCLSPPMTINTGFWATIFVFSKPLEFIDTLFLILRKRPVTILHWYHHITVTILSFSLLSVVHPISRYAALMNYVAHVPMYGYFFLDAIGFRLHRFCAMIITSLQIIQMFLGIYVAQKSLSCDQSVSRTPAYLALVIYFSYVILYGSFFTRKYLSKNKNK